MLKTPERENDILLDDDDDDDDFFWAIDEDEDQIFMVDEDQQPLSFMDNKSGEKIDWTSDHTDSISSPLQQSIIVKPHDLSARSDSVTVRPAICYSKSLIHAY